MIEYLIEIDFKIFEFINGLKLPLFLDIILTYWRNSYVWGPLYVFIISFAIFNFRKKAVWFLMFSTLTVGTTDFVSSNLIKKNVERLRPCNTEQLQVINRVKCSTGYSFTSSHATNHFGMATFWILTLSFIERRYKILLGVWAGLIAFCQVYVGVHFPSDVIAGSILGFSIGYLFYKLYFKFYSLN